MGSRAGCGCADPFDGRNVVSPLGIVSIVAGVALLAAAGMGLLLKNSYAENGKLEASLTVAVDRLKLINQVQKERDAIHGTNLALPDSELFDRLLKTPGGRSP